MEVPLSARTGRISANGRFVALISAARLVEHDRNDLRDVYVFDGETGRFSLESLGRLGQPADGASRAVDISADGRFLVFAAEAGNLTDAPFPPGTPHVFLRDRIDGRTRLLTIGASGDPANGPSRNPVIDAAGTIGGVPVGGDRSHGRRTRQWNLPRQHRVRNGHARGRCRRGRIASRREHVTSDQRRRPLRGVCLESRPDVHRTQPVPRGQRGERRLCSRRPDERHYAD